ncbi:MAG: doubled motif LPXTG anchor domain-containing protein [Anaerotignum sp.]|nr:doubled motif LPXTG anchor domain-containing protein [Anaerotignum sp.]
MKKLFALMMTAILAFGMAGCGGSAEPAGEDSAMLTDKGAEDVIDDGGIVIFEEDVPLAEIPEEDVPLAEVPKTGDEIMGKLLVTLLAGAGLAALAVTGKKKEEF